MLLNCMGRGTRGQLCLRHAELNNFLQRKTLHSPNTWIKTRWREFFLLSHRAPTESSISVGWEEGDWGLILRATSSHVTWAKATSLYGLQHYQPHNEVMGPLNEVFRMCHSTSGFIRIPVSCMCPFWEMEGWKGVKEEGKGPVWPLLGKSSLLIIFYCPVFFPWNSVYLWTRFLPHIPLMHFPAPHFPSCSVIYDQSWGCVGSAFEIYPSVYHLLFISPTITLVPAIIICQRDTATVS